MKPELTRFGKGLIAVLIAITIVVVAAPFVRNHLAMAQKLEPLKEEFRTTAAENGHLVHHYESGFPDNIEYDYWDYDGKLDDIIKRRDDFLARNGYDIAGKWYVEGMGKYTSFNCLYYVRW